jgi:hypothetical protein
MKQLFLFSSLIFFSLTVFTQKNYSSLIELEIPELEEENSMTKEEFMDIDTLYTNEEGVIVQSYTLTTVDTAGYIHDIHVEGNKFSDKAIQWIKKQVIPGHKLTFEDLIVQKEREEIFIKPKVIDIEK